MYEGNMAIAIEGCLTALVTPFKGGRVDFESLAKLVDWQIESGIDGIVSVGTTGESATLDVDEHVAVITATVKAARGRVPVIAGAGGHATSEASLGSAPVPGAMFRRFARIAAAPSRSAVLFGRFSP